MKTNFFISLLVVIGLIVVFVRFSHWIQKKSFFKKNMFSQKKNSPNVNVNIISIIDENYKVVNINDKNSIVLLGPQNALVLEETKVDKNTKDVYPYLEKKAS